MSKPDFVLLHAPSNYDFRKRAIMYGPISDVIPSTPLFEMYPIGFVSIAAYLEKHGVSTRVVNIANRMLTEPKFDVERFLAKLSPLAFGIDLHWLPHAQGSLELARIVKRLHPATPVIFGGFSATYFYQELIQYPEVDFVIRGDSAEQPLLELVQQLKAGASVQDVPNLSWKDAEGAVYHNSLSSVPDSIDDISLDYAYPVKSVVKYRGLASLLPFNNWLDYPLTAVFTCRGCTLNCLSCGGSRYFFQKACHRERPAYRSPKLLAEDIHSIQRYLKGPVFIIGDIRQPGEDYAEELLQAMSARGVAGPIVLELFGSASAQFFQRVSEAIPNFNIQMSPESHDVEIRRAFGKGWNSRGIEDTIANALESGCQRFDLFFMIGLPKQDRRSVMDTVAYTRTLLQEFGADKRLHPHISPLAPFIDPGSELFEHPEEHGYNLFYHTLEEHRQALLRPSWKYTLSYENEWLSRDEIVDVTYEAALGFNQMKADYGLISSDAVAGVEDQIRRSMELSHAIDRVVKERGFEFEGEIPWQRELEKLNLATTCHKRELEWPARSFVRSMPRILYAFCRGGWS